MSTPYTYTTHTLTTEDPQDLQTQIDPRVAAYLADLNAALSVPLIDDQSPWSTTISRMKRGLEGAVQDPGQAHRRQWKDLDECAQWILAHQKIGPKHEQPCLHTGIVRWPGDTHKANCAGVQSFYFDLDGAIRGAEELETVKVWARSKGCHIIHSSASHDPAAGSWRVKILLRIDRTLGYEIAARVAKMLRQEIADALGRPMDNSIDPCTERAMQVQLVPAWQDESRKAQAFLTVHHGPCMDVGPYLAIVHQEMEEEAQLHQAKVEAAKAIRPQLSGVDPVLDDGSVDKIDLCREDLRRMPIPAGSGCSNSQLAAALWRCREWGLDLAWAEQVMIEVYGPQGQSTGWLGAKCRSIYALSDPEGQSGRRLRLAQTRALFAAAAGGVREFGLDESSGGHPENTVNNRADLSPFKMREENESARLFTVECNAGPKTIQTRYLPEVDLQELATRGKIHLTKSACGTGKNHRLAGAFSKAAKAGEMLVATSCRQSLCGSMADDLGLANYLEVQTREITVPVAVCLDSLPRVPRLTVCPEGFEETHLRVLLLDEVQQTFRHLFGETIAGKNQCGVIWNDLKHKIAHADLVLAQDADLDYLTLFGLHVLSGQSLETIKSNLVINTWQDPDLRAKRFTSEGAWWRSLLAWGEVDSIACFCTTKTAARKLAREYRRIYPDKKALVIDGDQGGDPEVQAALRDRSLLGSYDTIFYNSAWGTGVDITIPNKFRVFGHLKAGELIAQDCRQGLSRVRHPIGHTWNIVMCGSSPQRETDPDRVMENLLSPSHESVRRLRAIGTGWSPVYRRDSKQVEALAPDNMDLVRVWAIKEAYEAEWGGTYHTVVLKDGTTVEGSFERHLRDLGIPLLDAYDALEPEQEAEADDDLKTAKKAEDDAEIERMITARHSTDEEVEKIEAQPRTLETTAIVQAHKLRRFYGWDVLDEQKIKWDKKGRGRKKCRTYQHVLLVEDGKREPIDAKDARDIDTGYMVHFRNLGVEADTILELWQQVFGLQDLRRSAEQGTIIKARKNILANPKARVMLARNLDMHFKKEDQANIMNLARSLAGRMGLKLKPGKQTRLPNGKRVQEYSLDPAAFLEMDTMSAAYREHLLNPQGAAKTTIVHMGPKAGELQEILAGILDDAA